jgi:hypothetical protein
MDAEIAETRRLRDALERSLFDRIPDLVLNGHPTLRLPNTVNISFRHVEGEALLLNLDMMGIACSSGSACTSGSLEASPVLLAMGADPTDSRGTAFLPRIREQRRGRFLRRRRDREGRGQTACDVSPLRSERGQAQVRKGRILAAMSGGVDSSVAALLLRRDGREVIGVSMVLYESPAEERDGEEGGRSDGGLRDARRVCEHLGIPHHVLDLREEFRREVIGPFIDEYRAEGRQSLHPLQRAPEIPGLLQKADEFGADGVPRDTTP